MNDYLELRFRCCKNVASIFTESKPWAVSCDHSFYFVCEHSQEDNIISYYDQQSSVSQPSVLSELNYDAIHLTLADDGEASLCIIHD